MLMLHNFISPNGNADNNLITMEDISKYDSILDYYTSDKYLYEIE